jgi:hypothetical protein
MPRRAAQDNPQFFGNPLQFEIQYECLQSLENGELPAQHTTPFPSQIFQKRHSQNYSETPTQLTTTKPQGNLSP